MNVLFISRLSGNLWAGPSVCIPEIVKYQSYYDNVFWYNLNHVRIDSWLGFNGVFANIDDIPSERLRDLPSPFSCPDLAVIEEVYTFPFCKIVKDLIKNRIPYVVVPHSQLTLLGQNQKKIKKIIANAIWFNKMINKAVAIQYLSVGEQKNSERKWKNRSYVVPNGIKKQDIIKMEFDTSKKIRAVYIGRLDIYQKGLDYLIEAVAELKEELVKAGFSLSLYGPKTSSVDKELEELIHRNNVSEIITVNDGVFGERKEKILLDADVFIMCSRFEGHSLGLIEALSYGIPCIACEGTYMTEEISEYNAGWIGESSKQGVEKALKEVIYDRKDIALKGIGAKCLADTYSWDSIASKNHQVYLELVNETH